MTARLTRFAFSRCDDEHSPRLRRPTRRSGTTVRSLLFRPRSHERDQRRGRRPRPPDRADRRRPSWPTQASSTASHHHWPQRRVKGECELTRSSSFRTQVEPAISHPHQTQPNLPDGPTELRGDPPLKHTVRVVVLVNIVTADADGLGEGLLGVIARLLRPSGDLNRDLQGILSCKRW
jgi:hypothetical protein